MKYIKLILALLVSTAFAGKVDKVVTSIYFDTGAHVINSSQSVSLQKAAVSINADKMVVAIVGNADKRGGRLYNLDLAERRANAVKKALIELGVPEDQLVVSVSQGKEKPLAPADGLKEHLQVNRRVDIVQIKALTVTKVHTESVIVPHEVEKFLVRRHRISFLGGFAPSGITSPKLVAPNTFDVRENFDFELGLSYSYLTSLFKDRLSITGSAYSNKSAFVGLGLDF